MGGVVSGIGDFVGDAVGGVSGAVGGALGFVPGIGPYLGPAVTGALLGPAAGFKSLAFNAATGQYGGGGGGGSSGGVSVPRYAEPNYNYGANTYQMNNSPIDTSKYFITGDKGVYNLMPALGQINPKTIPSSHGIYNEPFANSVANKSYYTPYEAYTDLSKQMANDPKALAAFQAMYKPTTPSMSGLNPYVDFGLGTSIGDNATYGDIAKYASTNQNPFYVPYSGSGGKPSTFTTPEMLAAQKKAEEKARFDRLSPERQQEILAQRKTAMTNLMNRIDPDNTIKTAIQNRIESRRNTPGGIASLRKFQ